VIRSLLMLWVSGMASAIAALILVPSLFYLTYLLLSAVASAAGHPSTPDDDRDVCVLAP
jgi:hypothetical protein